MMRLVDCFMEIIAYTKYLLATWKTSRPCYEDVLKQYERLFSRAEDFVKRGGFSEEEGTSALFAICAWVDERILCSDWPEKEKWSRVPMQLLRFDTTNAGEDFFRRMEKLEEKAVQVREVYAYCIALGFRGRYFHAEDEKVLENIRRGILPEMEEPGSPDKLFPQAYGSSTERGRGRKWFLLFSPAKIPFILIPVIVFAGLFFLYQHMLRKMASDFIGAAF